MTVSAGGEEVYRHPFIHPLVVPPEASSSKAIASLLLALPFGGPGHPWYTSIGMRVNNEELRRASLEGEKR